MADRSSRAHARVQLCIDLPRELGGPRGEWVWADALGGDRFRIDNVPFWAPDIHRHDVVRARRRDDGALHVTRVVRCSGHRTVVVLFTERALDAEQRELVAVAVRSGAELETAERGLYAIDLPPHVDVQALRRRLDALEREHLATYAVSEPPGPARA